MELRQACLLLSLLLSVLSVLSGISPTSIDCLLGFLFSFLTFLPFSPQRRSDPAAGAGHGGPAALPAGPLLCPPLRLLLLLRRRSASPPLRPPHSQAAPFRFVPPGCSSPAGSDPAPAEAGQRLAKERGWREAAAVARYVWREQRPLVPLLALSCAEALSTSYLNELIPPVRPLPGHSPPLAAPPV